MLTKTGPHGRLILVEKPGCFYHFGLFFIFIGLLAAGSTLLVSPLNTEISVSDRWITAAVGLLAAAGGAYFFVNTPRSQIEVTEDGKKLTVSRTSFQFREHESFIAADIDDVYVVNSGEPGPAQSYSLGMRLRNGKEIPLSVNLSSDRELLEENARLLKKHLFLSKSA